MRRIKGFSEEKCLMDDEDTEPGYGTRLSYPLRSSWRKTGRIVVDEREIQSLPGLINSLCNVTRENPSVTEDPDDPWVYLASAIVLQAARDYCEGAIHGYRDDIKDCRKFFHSDFFRKLTALDPDILLERLDDEIAVTAARGGKITICADDELFRK